MFKLTNGNVKAVCSRIGNSPAIAMQHYAQVTDADFNEATKMSVISQAEDALQKALQTGTESGCTESHKCCTDIDATLCECDTKPQDETICDNKTNDIHWAVRDLNPRLPACKAGALAN